jgi:hypothetical protein
MTHAYADGISAEPRGVYQAIFEPKDLAVMGKSELLEETKRRAQRRGWRDFGEYTVTTHRLVSWSPTVVTIRVSKELPKQTIEPTGEPAPHGPLALARTIRRRRYAGAL